MKVEILTSHVSYPADSPAAVVIKSAGESADYGYRCADGNGALRTSYQWRCVMQDACKAAGVKTDLFVGKCGFPRTIQIQYQKINGRSVALKADATEEILTPIIAALLQADREIAESLQRAARAPEPREFDHAVYLREKYGD